MSKTTKHVERDKFGKTNTIETTTTHEDGSSDSVKESVSEKVFGATQTTVVSRTRTDKDGNSSTRQA